MHLNESILEEIKNDVYQSMYHTFLHEYVALPELESEKLFLLLSILESTTLTLEQKKSVAKTIMFVQVALDAHDLVKNDDETQNLDVKIQTEQQLTVLAGDYYSGLYYRTLSYLPDIPLITQLATAIKIINEQKIRVYQCEIHSIEDYLNSMQQIETCLYQKLASYYDLTDYEIIATNWLYGNRILKYKENYIDYIVENKLIVIDHDNINERTMIENWLYKHIQELNQQLTKYVKNETLLTKFLDINNRFEPSNIK